jgi:hypothetical protein
MARRDREKAVGRQLAGLMLALVERNRLRNTQIEISI